MCKDVGRVLRETPNLVLTACRSHVTADLHTITHQDCRHAAYPGYMFIYYAFTHA